MNRFKNYIEYFKHQCENHPLLVHADSIGSRVFEVISVEEAIGDLRTTAKEKDFIFRLIEYTFDVTNDSESQIRKYTQGAFIIAKYHSPRKTGKTDYYTAVDDSEKVAEDIITKMIADSQNGHPLFFHSLDSRQNITAAPLISGEDGTHSGWIVTFRFAPYFEECVPEDLWLDGGLTPFD